MLSFGSDGVVAPAQMWLQVWKHQLKLVTEEHFWRGLSGEDVHYVSQPEPEPAEPLLAFSTSCATFSVFRVKRSRPSPGTRLKISSITTIRQTEGEKIAAVQSDGTCLLCFRQSKS